MKMCKKISLIGKSPVFLETLEKASKLKGHRANTLITGKSGTGKEMLARFIHGLENNPARPFIAINCAAIPENLMESELFGYERGAFTGAFDKKIGKFELANGGDIFLDEISTLPLHLQAKLLRILQEKEFYRLGSKELIKSDFRVIAATNEVLKNKMDAGLFREDLYHRIAVVELAMPSLYERCKDIPLLVEYFIKRYSNLEQTKQFSDVAMQALCEYDWPGNIRELENVIHNLIIMTQNNVIGVDDLPEKMGNNPSPSIRVKVLPCNDPEMSISSWEEYQETVKEEYILDVLYQTDWNLSKAAKLLRMGRSTLFTYLKGLELETRTVD